MPNDINPLLADVAAVTAEAKAITNLAAEALRQLAGRLPSALWRKRRIAWSRSRYADCNARGDNQESTYESSANTICVVAPKPKSGGGQNEGHYYLDDDDDSLYFHRDGSLSTCSAVEGEWSCWQGSSSSYELSFTRVTPLDAHVERVTAVVALKLQARLEELREKKMAGAKAAKDLLAALARVLKGKKTMTYKTKIVLAEEEGEFSTRQVFLAGESFFVVEENGGARGAHDRMDGDGVWRDSPVTPAEKITRDEALALCAEMGVSEVDLPEP